MTTKRDPEALLAAYLADGMSVLPDRVVDAVLDEVHRTRQRAVLGPWRTRPMLKIGLAAAAVVAVVIGGGALLGAFRMPPGPGTESLSPGPAQTATPAPTLSPSPTPGLPAFPGSDSSRVAMPAGTTYRAVRFSQPMTLTLPDVTAELGPEAVAVGFTYGGGGHTMQINYPPNQIGITIHDDFKIDTNFCRPDGQTQEVPATPEAVGEWLHSLANPGVEGVGGLPNVITDQPDMTVDGRVAKVYNVEFGSMCDSTRHQGDVWSGRSRGFHRMYAIPTGTDTILVITWNDGDNCAVPRDPAGTCPNPRDPEVVPQESVNAIADRLVASFEFD